MVRRVATGDLSAFKRSCDRRWSSSASNLASFPHAYWYFSDALELKMVAHVDDLRIGGTKKNLLWFREAIFEMVEVVGELLGKGDGS